VIDRHAQVGNPVAHAHDIGQQRHTRIRRIQNQVRIGQGFQIGDKLRPLEFLSRSP
jgi:hypothetical protein